MHDPSADHGRARLSPELACLDSVFTAHILERAQARAADRGTGGDRVLISAGIIDEEAYVQYLASALGVTFETFSTLDGAFTPLPDTRLGEAAATGLLPLRDGDALVWIVAPQGHGAQRLAQFLAISPELALRIRLTTTARLDAFIQQIGRRELARLAASQLNERWPDLSAAPLSSDQRRLGYWPRLLAVTLAAVMFPAFLAEAMAALFAGWFLAFSALRLVASIAAPASPAPLHRLPDDQLPIYTIIAALYHEASSVPDLVAALRNFDYPPEKLDIKLAVEADDLQTRAAIARLGPLPNVQVIVAPTYGPRTKPKALNATLPFARGSFTVVYDAEDRPERTQLRDALDAFRRHDLSVACAQASLCIDNTSDSWLSRMFCAEYAGQFDVFLPGFAAFRLPLPLGGSSNHFRTSVLRAVAGWDAYNVTEDADLGVRLARFGYHSVTFTSTTYEEAPAQMGAWLRQRTRWMKGWMQTWAVHMRTPWHLLREVGVRGFLTLNVAIGGNVLTALAHPIFLAMMLVEAGLLLSGHTGFLFDNALANLHLAALFAGYATPVILGCVGLRRRGLLRNAWVLTLIPFYWLLLSAAAWRAFHQWMTDPYHWEKTAHGLARRSPSATIGARAAVVTESGANRRAPRREVA